MGGSSGHLGHFVGGSRGVIRGHFWAIWGFLGGHQTFGLRLRARPCGRGRDQAPASPPDQGPSQAACPHPHTHAQAAEASQLAYEAEHRVKCNINPETAELLRELAGLTLQEIERLEQEQGQGP